MGQGVIEKRRFSSLFCACPADLQTKVSFCVGLWRYRRHLWPGTRILYYKARTNDVDPAMFPTQLFDLEQNVIAGIQAETRPLGSVSRILVFKDLKDSSRLPARYRRRF